MRNTLADLKLQYQAINPSRFEQLLPRFASLSADPEVHYMDLYTDSNGTEILHNMVGQYAPGTNGRWFRLALNGATKLVVGNLLQGAAEDSQFDAMAVTASAVSTSGIQTVNVTNGTTTVNMGDYMGGSVGVNVTPDLGSDYVITGHTTATSGGALVLTIDRKLQNAWTTSTKVNMKRNPWAGVIQNIATTPTQMPTGVAIWPILATTVATTTSWGTPQYGWIQTHGVSTVSADASAILKGSAVSTGSGTAGAVQLHPFSGNASGVGNALMPNGSASKDIAIFLTID